MSEVVGVKRLPSTVIVRARGPRVMVPARGALGIAACTRADAARGGALFVISDEPVTFWELATLFRDALGCRNALFLDGTVASLYAPELHRKDDGFPLGPIVGIVEPANR